MKHTKNRILSLVLTFCMMLSLLPVGTVTAGAAGAHAVTPKLYNLTSSNVDTSCGDSFSTTLTANSGKTLSDYISVTLGGNMLGSENYTYTRAADNITATLDITGLTGNGELIINAAASNQSNDWYTSWELAAVLARNMKYTPATSTISWDSLAPMEYKYANDDTGSNKERLCGFTIVAYQGLDPENTYFAKMERVPLTTDSITTRQLLDTTGGTANWSSYDAGKPLKLRFTIERYTGETIWKGSVSSYFFEFKDVPNPSTVKNLTVNCTNAKIASSTTHTQQVSSTVDIQPITVTADSGYALPDTITGTNGLTYTPAGDKKTATISGKMTADTNLTVTAVMNQVALTVTPGKGMTLTNGSQTIAPGAAITEIAVTAAAGYVLPATYDMGSGLTFTNTNDIIGKVTGSITGAVTVTIKDATPDVSGVVVQQKAVGSTALVNFKMPSGFTTPTVAISGSGATATVEGTASMASGYSFLVRVSGPAGTYTITPSVTKDGQSWPCTPVNVTLTVPHGKTKVTVDSTKHTIQVGKTSALDTDAKQIQTTQAFGGWKLYGAGAGSAGYDNPAVVELHTDKFVKLSPSFEKGTEVEACAVLSPYQGGADSAFSQVTIALWNKGSDVRNYRFSLGADVQIEENDKADIKYVAGKGFRMTDGSNILALINTASGDDGAAEYKWWGPWEGGAYTKNVLKEVDVLTDLTGEDSAAAAIFNVITLKAGEMMIFNVAFGAGDATTIKDINTGLGITTPGVDVGVTLGANMALDTGSGALSQVVIDAITPIKLKAAAGYTLPKTWAVGNGLVYACADPFTTATITGTPSAAVTTTVPKAEGVPYKVSYDVNGGTGVAMANSEHVYGTDKALSTCTYAFEHYTCDGWATAANGNKVYDLTQLVKNLTTTKDAVVPLFAHWVPKQYTVKITAGTGMTLSDNAATQEITYNGPIDKITVTAAAGYVLPATWTAAELNGLTYTRKTLTTAEITGNPTAVVDVIVPNAVKMVPEVDTNGKGLITVTTDPGKEYKINPSATAVDKDGVTVDPDTDGWVNTENGPITFKPLNPGVNYTVSTRPKEDTGAPTGGNGTDEGITVPVIGGNVHATKDPGDDTKIQIIIDPASAGLKYAVLDAGGTTQIYPTSAGTWITDAVSPIIITLPGLIAGTKYQIVAVPTDTAESVTPLDKKDKGTTITTPTVDIGTGVVVSKVDRLPVTPAETPAKDKIVIAAPTDTGKDYGITDPDTGVTEWKTGTGSELTFDKLDPTKKYEVSIRENNKPSGDPSVPSVGVTVDVNIPTTNITGGYVKGDSSPANDKTTITVKPANPGLDYGIVDEHGAPVAAPNDVWKPGTIDGVKFEGLTPGTNYKVVTRPHQDDVTAKPAVNEIPGGTGIVTPVPPVDPDTVTREVDTGHGGKDKITINPTTTGQVYTLVDPGTGAVLAGPTISTGDPITFDTLDPNTKYELAVVKPGVDGGVGVPGKGVVVGKIGVASVSSTVKDESGNPVVGATVSITVATTDGGFRTITTTTDKDGKYTLSGDDVKLPGDYAIYVDGGAKGCETLPVTLTVAQPQAIADITTKVANKNIFGGAAITVDGKPVTGSTIELIDKNTGLPYVPTEEHIVKITTTGGGYVIENLEDGTYIIQTTDGTKSGMTEIVVKGGKILPNIEGGFKNTNISTVPGGIVTGKITVLGVGEKAKVTITVPIVDEHGAIIGTKNVTAQAVGGVGHYQFAGVPDGKYPVTVVGPDGKLTVSTITVGSGAATGGSGDIAIPDTKPEKPNVVTGIVMDKNGKPVPDATVKLYDKTGALVTTDPATVTTGKGGGWAVKGLDPEKGPFTVTVDKNGTNGVVGPVTVDVSGKVTGKTNVELPGTVNTGTGAVTPDVAGKLLTGKVTDSAGKPAEGATVVVKDSAGNVIAKTTTNKDGIYFVPNVPTGATVTVITKNGENGKPGSLGSGDTLNGNTATTKPGSQLLTVIGPKGDVLPVTKSTESDTVAHIAVVGVAPTVNPDDANVKITGDKLDVSELPDGTYKVTVTQNGMTLTKDIEVKNHAIVGDNTMTATSKTVEGKLDYGSGTIPSDATVTIKGGSPADYIWGSATVNPKDGSYKITGIPEGSYTVEVAVKNPDASPAKDATITNTVTVTKDGAVTFGSDWAADKGADITTGTGGKLTVTPSTAVTTVTAAITTALGKTDAGEVKTVIDAVKALTEEEQKQIKTDEVKKLSDKLQELLKTKLTVAADATGVTAATKEATKGVLNDQKGLLVTGDEVTAAASKTVKVGLTLDAENVTSNPPADKNKAEAAAKGGDIGAFFDISVTKTTEVTSSDGAKSTATEKVPVLPVAVPVTLAIPAEIQGHAYYNVIRVHNGVAERIPATATQTTVSFLSSLYSTYAIAYSDDPIFPDDKPAVDEDKNGGNTGGNAGGGATVQPVTGGSVTTSPRNPKPGDKVTITVNPDKGYKVDTVKVLDKNGKEVDVTKNGDGTYSYIQPEGKVRIDVKFKKAGTQVGPFTDVTNDQWFAEAVEFVYKEKLFNGVAPDKFGPQITTTRGMFVTVLGRLAKVDVTQWTAKSKFPDVVSSAYYAPYVAWGEAQGIVLGFDDGNYRPDALVTREQMAAILYRYVQKNGGGYKGDWAYLLPYADKGNISDYALEAISWCNQNSIINGKGGNRLDPTGNATRAEVAAVIQRFAGLTK